MVAITFDTLKFVNRLKKSGISEKQANAISAAHKNTLSEMDIATKQDLRELEYRLTYKLTMRFGGMLFGGLTLAITIIVTLIKFL